MGRVEVARHGRSTSHGKSRRSRSGHGSRSGVTLAKRLRGKGIRTPGQGRKGKPGGKDAKDRLSYVEAKISIGRLAATIEDPCDLWHMQKAMDDYTWHLKLKHMVVLSMIEIQNNIQFTFFQF